MRSRTRWLLILACGIAGAPFAHAAEPIPQSENSDVAVLPPTNAHRFLVTDAVYSHAKDGRIYLIDADNARLLATIQAAFYANAVADPQNRYYAVAETVWAGGNRGPRQDLLTLYNPHTLDQSAQITLPGRALITTKRQDMDVSADGNLLYVYNLSPSNEVIVADAQAHRVLGSIAVPGCGLAFAWGTSGFSSICADGSLANVAAANTSHPSITHTKPFFPVETDPVFEQSPTNRATGRTWFVSYTGLVYGITLGPNATPDAPWSIQQAAGQPRAPGAEAPRVLAWRPGGWQVASMHRADQHLFVLMHQGPFWTHKVAGTELWEIDAASHHLLRRIRLPTPAQSVSVTQDATPLILVTADTGRTDVIDGTTGTLLRTMPHLGDQLLLSQAQGE